MKSDNYINSKIKISNMVRKKDGLDVNKDKQSFNETDFSEVFGSLKFKKSAQKLKNLAKEGWD